MNRGTVLLVRYMSAKDLTQAQVAKTMKVHQTTVSTWRLGRPPRKASTLIALQKEFKIPIEAWETRATPEEAAEVEAAIEKKAS